MAEAPDLRIRYDQACVMLNDAGLDPARREIEEIANSAKATLSVPVEFATQLFRGNTLHQNYYSGDSGRARQSAARENDLIRRTVDGRLFGRIAEDLTMAALSPDGRGLRSYGQVFLEFHDLVVRHRGSLLVENSYDFYRRYADPTREMPKGLRAAWAERAELAVTKLAEPLMSSRLGVRCVDLLMEDSGDRAHDKFLEVHIFGPWDHQAIARVRGPSTLPNAYDNAQLDELRARLAALSIPWEDLP
jgi:hypothetical protein